MEIWGKLEKEGEGKAAMWFVVGVNYHGGFY